jgi:hypothetical protein
MNPSAVQPSIPGPKAALAARPPRFFVVVLVMWLSCASNAWAHHSYAMFDWNQSLTVRGVVKTVEWAAPHVWVWVAVEGDAPMLYGFETASPGELTRFANWTARSIHVGDPVIVEFSPLRSGRPGGVLRTITLPDGRRLESPTARARPSPPPAPAPAPAPATQERPR